MNKHALEMYQSTIKTENGQILVKPVCDFFVISDQIARRSFFKDPILFKYAIKDPSKLLFRGSQQHISLSKKDFIRWVRNIELDALSEEFKIWFLMYQAYLFEFLFESGGEIEHTELIYTREKLKHLREELSYEIRLSQYKIAKYWERHNR
jgi:hypothetical protein